MIHDAPGNRGGERGHTIRNLTKLADEGVLRLVFQEVAVGPGGEGADDPGVIAHYGGDDAECFRAFLFNLAQHIEAGTIGEAKVEHGKVKPGAGGGGEAAAHAGFLMQGAAGECFPRDLAQPGAGFGNVFEDEEAFHGFVLSSPCGTSILFRSAEELSVIISSMRRLADPPEQGGGLLPSKRGISRHRIAG